MGNGSCFWKQLKDFGIMQAPEGDKEDDHLLSHGYGIVNIAKVPGGTGDEPTDEEHTEGLVEDKESNRETSAGHTSFCVQAALTAAFKCRV
jgi:hypothetical protein